MRTFVFLLLTSCIFVGNSLALDIKDIKPSILKDEVTMKDLITFLDVSIYKYKLRIPPGYSAAITLENVAENKNIFSHPLETTRQFEHTLKINFLDGNESPFEVWDSKTKSLIYSVNWDYQGVFSGTITNFMEGITNYYIESNTFDFGKELTGKTSILKFFKVEQDGSNETLIAELYLTTTQTK